MGLGKYRSKVTGTERMKKIRVILLAAVWITVMAVMGCQKDDSHSEQSVKAILESFLSCSVQDVQEIRIPIWDLRRKRWEIRPVNPESPPLVVWNSISRTNMGKS